MTPPTPAAEPNTSPPWGAGRREPNVGEVILAALKLYKSLLSPLFAGSCRYLPSCSDYMAESVERHGAAINETMAAAEKLSELSKELKTVAARFNL